MMRKTVNRANKETGYFRAALGILACALILIFPVEKAAANVSVSPLRVVFDSRARNAEVTILNLANTLNTYRMSWLHYRQTENGGYEVIEEPVSPGLDLTEAITFSPRQVAVPGQGRQRVRLSVRRPADLPDGEYRAHLKFQKLLEKEPIVKKGGQAAQKGVTAELFVNVGVAIPVLVRQGEYNASAKIANPRFISQLESKSGKPQLEFTINREGLHSTIGRVTIYWDKSQDRPDGRIGILNNVAIYTENNKRVVRVNLTEEAITSGNVTIRYSGSDADRGKLFDEVTFPVGG